MARKKKHITYDSKETHTIIGLISLLLGIFFILSIVSGTENSNNLFAQAKNLFGDSTIFTALFLISLGMFFLGVELPFTKKSSLVSQAALVILIPALITSLSTTPRELARSREVLGGEVGFLIVNTVLGDTLPTQPATKFILLALTIIFIPLALSMSISELIDKIAMIIKWLFNFIGSNSNVAEEQAAPDEKATNFGDFNKLLKEKQMLEDQNRELMKHEKKFDDVRPVLIPRGEAANISIKEGAVGENGLSQETLRFPNWKLPPLSLLKEPNKANSKEPAIVQNGKIIEQILASFGIEAKVEDSFVGPSVIQYALNIPLGVKVEKISNLSANVALALGVDSNAVRIDSIPGTTYLGIEVPRSKRDMVRMRELMESKNMVQTSMELPVPIGKNIDGSAIIGDIKKMPHLLIAGATGSGKSVLTNSFITSLLLKRTPDEVRLILVDPKQVELSDYNGIPHLLTPVITDMDKVINALKWAVGEMEKRYTVLAVEKVRNIEGYNEKKGFAAMPYIVIVIDEMADMMMTSNKVETETAIVRLAQKARAVGIHLILATQRPSVNVITGIIKANIPGRIGMSVASSTDSRVILDRIGSESLLGYGDLLYKAPDSPKATRLQGAFIEQGEVNKVVDFIKSQAPEVEYINEIVEKQAVPGEEIAGGLSNISEDNLLEQAIRIVVQSQKGSSSYLQRRLNIGFNRAARLLEELEEAGVVGGPNGSKPREVLVSDADAFIASLKSGGAA